MTPIEWLESAGSTNSVLRDRAVRFGDAVATLHQTDGRGRVGRQWLDVPGRGLAISVALTWENPPALLTRIPLIAGAALIDAVTEIHGDNELWMKWPNDVYAAEKKIAGVLTEMPAPGTVIVGMGVNVGHTVDELPVDTASSLSVLGIDIDPAVLAEAWRRILVERVDTLDEPATHEWVASRLGWIGDDVRIEFPDGTSRTVTIIGIRADGALTVSSNGHTESIVAGDITRIRREP